MLYGEGWAVPASFELTATCPVWAIQISHSDIALNKKNNNAFFISNPPYGDFDVPLTGRMYQGAAGDLMY
jgi:hypothetical protein